MNLDDLKRLFKACTFGAAKQNPPCKVCDKPCDIVVPGDGFYCKWHTPGDVEVMEFPTTKLCETITGGPQPCTNKATMDCQYCSANICERCSYGTHEYGRCTDKD